MKIKGFGHEAKRTYRKYGGCRMCKPYKHGGAPRKKSKEIARLKAMAEEVNAD